jgi:hypothetical protein
LVDVTSSRPYLSARGRCYVNPDNPEEAAISRDFHANQHMIIVPIALLLVGLLGIVYVLITSVPDKNATPPKTPDSA